mmetsp:Transcript_27838/g.66136  ORF Transcript_27838/g.66136 Transcript_27838/m.66136 type:complete len:250 (-) Transcript_27838:439-1188(-)
MPGCNICWRGRMVCSPEASHVCPAISSYVGRSRASSSRPSPTTPWRLWSSRASATSRRSSCSAKPSTTASRERAAHGAESRNRPQETCTKAAGRCVLRQEGTKRQNASGSSRTRGRPRGSPQPRRTGRCSARPPRGASVASLKLPLGGSRRLKAGKRRLRPSRRAPGRRLRAPWSKTGGRCGRPGRDKRRYPSASTPQSGRSIPQGMMRSVSLGRARRRSPARSCGTAQLRDCGASRRTTGSSIRSCRW